MANRANKLTNDASDSSDKRAPLSSYLPYDSQEDALDGWTIVSSENGVDLPARTPDLSVLKQIKNFLNNKSDESEASFDSSNFESQNFRVDYPFYDSEPESRRTSTGSEEEHDVSDFREEFVVPASKPAILPITEEQSDAELTHAARRVDDKSPETAEKPEQLSSQASLATRIVPESASKETVVELLSKVDESPEHPQEELEPATEESVETKDDVHFDAPLQERSVAATDVETIEPAAFVLDANELIGTSFQEVAPILETGDVPEIVETTCDVPKWPDKESRESELPPPESRRPIISDRVADTNAPEELRIVEAPRNDVAARRASKRRLPIFRRFVDLVTTRESSFEKRGDASFQRALPAQENDVVMESSGDRVDPAGTVEMIVAPYYTGANLNNPLESYVIGGGENVVS
ncbi:MAG: hypothetical protein IJL92_08125 [Thermoguttaceae bacterium]|nr:hypothetical protein [Thermoguttaceae bacterium]